LRISLLLVTIGLSFLPPVSGSAQEFPPLEKAMQDGAEESYPLVRCAAFYFSVLKYLGTDNIDAETVTDFKASLQSLMTKAVLVRMQKTGTDVDAATEAIQRDVFAIAGIYIERYRRNFADGGQAFGNDPLWTSDASLCGLLTEAAGDG
jgi:hypothetical protein